MNTPQLILAPDPKELGAHFKDHARNIKAHGFAAFNGYPHLCVEVPDGGFTITARTSEGKLVTFSFIPYQTGGAPQCVDIQRHNTHKTVRNGDENLPVQRLIAFKVGGHLWQSPKETPHVLTTLILKDEL